MSYSLANCKVGTNLFVTLRAVQVGFAVRIEISLAWPGLTLQALGTLLAVLICSLSFSTSKTLFSWIDKDNHLFILAIRASEQPI